MSKRIKDEKALEKAEEKKKLKKERMKNQKPKKGRGGYFVKRAVAFILDWYFSSVLANLAISLGQALFGYEIIIVKDLGSFPTYVSLCLLGFIFLTTIFYYMYVPMKVWPGQTLAMRAMQLKAVGLDGKEMTWKQLAVRFLVGCLLIEGTLYSFTTISLNYIMTLIPGDAGQLLDIIVGGIMGICSVISVGYCLYDRNHSQLFHDKLAKTEVIDLYAGGNGAL